MPLACGFRRPAENLVPQTFWRGEEDDKCVTMVWAGRLPLSHNVRNVRDYFGPDTTALLVLVPGDTSSITNVQLFDLVSERLTGKPFSRTVLRASNRIGFSPDGSRLASVGNDQVGTIIDLRTGKLAVPPFKHNGSILDLDSSPDGKRLLTAGLSSKVRLWDATTGELLLSPMICGDKGARTARWNADGRFIFGRNDNNFARVWDASTAEPVTPLLRHSGYIRWGCITPGGRLITASDPNLLRAWDLKPTPLAPDVIAEYAKLLSGRRLNPSGALLSLTSGELAVLFQSLRSRAPQLFE